MKKLLVLFLLSSAAFTSNAQQVEFKMKLPLNKPLKAVTTMKMDMEGAQSMIMDMTTKSTINVAKFESPNYTIENTTDAVKMDIDAGMMTISYDSENPSDDPTAAAMGAQFENLIGKKITMITSETGKVVKMEGVDDAQNPFGNVEMSATYPDKPVKPGDTWTSEATSNGITTKALNKYVEKTAEGYVIESTSDMFKDETKIGSVVSTYIADPSTFFTKSATIKMDMEVEGQKITSEVIMKVE